jgi:hypothetical protein
MQLSSVAAILTLVLTVGPAASQNTRGKAEVIIQGKKISIDYGRPSLQGRDMIGMAQVGTTWRLGMDEATEIESAGTLVVAGKELKPGKYTLWARKTGGASWILAFHPMTGVWGDPPLESGYAAQMPLKFENVPGSTEQLTITLANKAGEAAITVRWGSAELSGTFGVK